MGKKVLLPRNIFLNSHVEPAESSYNNPKHPNYVKSAKFNVLTFLPAFIPALAIGFLTTFLTPLLFVLAIALIKEAYDDIQRHKRDKAFNSSQYIKLDSNHPQGTPISAMDITVGDIIMVNTNQRVPCDCVLLKTSQKTGATFIRTDQLDGETDWKLRRAIPFSQNLPSLHSLLSFKGEVYAEAPHKRIYDFIGKCTFNTDPSYLSPETALMVKSETLKKSFSAFSTAHQVDPVISASSSLSSTRVLPEEYSAQVKGLTDVIIDGTDNSGAPSVSSRAESEYTGRTKVTTSLGKKKIRKKRRKHAHKRAEDFYGLLEMGERRHDKEMYFDEEIDPHQQALSSSKLHGFDDTKSSKTGRTLSVEELGHAQPTLAQPLHPIPGSSKGKPSEEQPTDHSKISSSHVESLGLENTLWMNTILASGIAVCLVIYTGNETRAVLNTTKPRMKRGKFDDEINDFSKLLFVLMFILSFLEVAGSGFKSTWWLDFIRFLLLFSAIIPISLAVNLDISKIVYQLFIQTDRKIPNTLVRSSHLPEQLGRVRFLFSDKTGTLTQNEMVFKKLHVGVQCVGSDELGLIRRKVREGLREESTRDKVHLHQQPIRKDKARGRSSFVGSQGDDGHPRPEDSETSSMKPVDASMITLPQTMSFASPSITTELSATTQGMSTKDEVGSGKSHRRRQKRSVIEGSSRHTHGMSRWSVSSLLYRSVRACALCHNVTPVRDESSGNAEVESESWGLHDIIASHKNSLEPKTKDHGKGKQDGSKDAEQAQGCCGACMRVKGDDYDIDETGHIVNQRKRKQSRGNLQSEATNASDPDMGGKLLLGDEEEDIFGAHLPSDTKPGILDPSLELSVTYQASSPDEVALVKFSESVGLTLSERELNWMRISTPSGGSIVYDILEIFPFSSVTKRMAIVVRERDTEKILIIVKGADSVIQAMIRGEGSEWLGENVDGMARDGLRTLVFAEKEIGEEEWARWKEMYDEAKASVIDRKERVLRVENELLQNMTLLSISGVEDLLQQNVRTSLESLRKAGIKVWMLTGDKVETAKCIARSTSLVDRTQGFSQIIGKDEHSIRRKLKQHIKNGEGNCLVIDGNTLTIALAAFPADGKLEDSGSCSRVCCGGAPLNGPGSLGGSDTLGELLIETACAAPCVVCCRVSPTQKAQMVNLAKKYTGLQTAAIGDGGNDVSMIQAADLGLGLVGKEGKQAAMASDFSFDKFCYILRLLFWHGRNCYTRGAHMTQFVCARGLTISILQAVFSALFYFSSMTLFSGFLLMGYSVIYTSLPVFAMCFDYDVESYKVMLYPELYKEVANGKVMSKKSFGVWIINSIYQGGVIMILTIFLFHKNFYSIVGLCFTALILTELFTLLFTVHHWTWQMIFAEISGGHYLRLIYSSSPCSMDK
ncbi:Probable phospholipid-transporting ATPase IIB [Aduncisulcus paluster]|uniref:Probable phospholipid-transporting ATPase IIB n=1 Tax=Aduncisulcus paluster TaxID=2918883 RepID=A0ABQ5K462_9EUKA|nr:Probable phospholipid-transporting ATPase IIB [Aduncisulcus paluster]